MNILKGIGILLIGVAIGYVEENWRYSVLTHEARKGDAKSQEIIDEFDKTGQLIEYIFNR